MLQMFYLDIARVQFGRCTFNERFECPMQHEIDVAVSFFFVINGWLTIFFNIFLMLRTVVFCVADNFRMLLFDILLDRWRLSHASKPPYFLFCFVLKQIPSHVYNNALLVFLRRLAREGP